MAADGTLEVSGGVGGRFSSARCRFSRAGGADAGDRARRVRRAAPRSRRRSGADALFIAFSFEPVRRTGDIDFPFRQEDNLLYLTSMTTPDATRVMLPRQAARQETLFASERDPSSERWTGGILSSQEVTDASAVKDVRPSPRFGGFIDAVLRGTAPAIAVRPHTTRRRSRPHSSPPSRRAARASGCCCRIAARTAGRRASSGSPRSCASAIRKCGSATRRRSSSRWARSRATRS